MFQGLQFMSPQRLRAVVLFLVTIGWGPLAIGMPVKAQEEDAGKSGGTEKAKGAKKKAGGDAPVAKELAKTKPGKGSDEEPAAKVLSIDEEYVRENLQEFLHPTKMEFLEDGRVKLMFDFSAKSEDHVAIFTPNVSNEINNTFRWSVRGEYPYWGGGLTGTGRAADDLTSYYGGLRIAMKGMALLNAWFTDDVEAEISYSQSVSHQAKQSAAVIFTNETGRSLGSNFGTQCAIFNRAGGVEKAKGTVESVINEQGMKFKLVARNGIFEAHRDGRQKQKLEYPKKSFAAGRIGFVWGGGIASFIPKLEITGRLDAKKMAKEIRKAKK